MKKLAGLVLLFSFVFGLSAHACRDIETTEDLLKDCMFARKGFEYPGSIEGMTPYTLFHKGHLVFTDTNGRLKLRFISNGNRHAWRSHYVYPRVGLVHFEVADVNGINGYQTFLEQFGEGDYETVVLEPKNFTFYVVEEDFQFQNRLNQLEKLDESYEPKGKFFGIGKFDANGITQIKYYEILPPSQETSQNLQLEYPIVIQRGTYNKPNRFR